MNIEDRESLFTEVIPFSHHQSQPDFMEIDEDNSFYLRTEQYWQDTKLSKRKQSFNYKDFLAAFSSKEQEDDAINHHMFLLKKRKLSQKQ